MRYETSFHDKSKLCNDARILDKHQLRSAAVFYLNKLEPLLRRAARVTRWTLEDTALPPYQGGALYPHGRWTPALPGDDQDGHGLRVDYSGFYRYTPARFDAFCETVEAPFEQLLLQRVSRDMKVYTATPMDMRFFSGGAHWIMDYPSMLRQGLTGYKERLLKAVETAADDDAAMFHEAMLDTVEGLMTLARRIADHLGGIQAETPSPRLERLVKAYARVPLQPAGDFFEAMVCVEFFSMYAASSEPGRLDQYLFPFYAADAPADAPELLAEFVANIDARVDTAGAWHMTLGGSDAAGAGAYNALTMLILKAMGTHRQPNTSLRVRKDMPDELWEQALDNLGSGVGNPALVNEEGFLAGFKKHLEVSDADLADFAFGGCAETLIAGKTNSHSLASILNLPEILEQAIMWDWPEAESFEAFYASFRRRLKAAVAELERQITLKHRHYAEYRMDTLRTLLTGGCLENAKGFHQGGAKHNFENSSVFGFANVLNSLYVLREIAAGAVPISKAELPAMLNANFVGYEQELAAIGELPKYGNGDQWLNTMAKELSELVFNEMNRHRCPDGIWRNTPSVIGYTTFVHAAKHVGATPDGRRRGEPFADSAGPMQGTDLEGPTETLRAAASLSQVDAVGTCVLNLLLGKDLFDSAEGRARLKALAQTYFELGGLQLQMTVVDKEILEDALKNPKEHGNLIVRIAGYNDYFTRQDLAIQHEILKRTRHQ